MSKFVLVNEAPEKLNDNELVITEPNFLDEIKIAKNQPRPMANGKHLTSLAHLRSIGGIIGELYDQEGFNPYSTIPYNHFVGIEYTNNEELSEVILKMFSKFYPKMLLKVLDKQIKSRPQGTELIYFVGSKNLAEAFFANGINQLDGGKTVSTAKKVTKNED